MLKKIQLDFNPNEISDAHCNRVIEVSADKDKESNQCIQEEDKATYQLV